MKKLFINSVKFTGVAVGVYLVMLILFIKYVPYNFLQNAPYNYSTAFTRTRLEEAKRTKDVDVLIVGSSHSIRGYDPRIFEQNGLSTFILGSNAQTPIQTKVLLDKYLNTLNPKFVIIDIFPVLFAKDGVEAASHLVTMDKLDNPTWEMVKYYNNIKLYNLLAYSYVAEKLKLNKGGKESEVSDKDRYVTGGYIETDRQGCKKTKAKSRNIVFLESQMSAFHQVVQILKDKRIDYVMIQTPVTAQFDDYTNEQQIDSFFASHGPYYNFNKLYPQLQSDSFYYDDEHLNRLGSIKFTNTLLPLVTEQLEAKKTGRGTYSLRQ